MCIYCDNKDTTESDIISKFFTRKKLTKKFVCEQHNSLISSKYESAVSKNLTLLRNWFGLESRNHSKEISTEMKIIVDGQTYKPIKCTELNDYFWNNTCLESESSNANTLSLMDFEQSKEITVEYTEANVCVNEFESLNMKKVIAKVSYEYYCLCNNIFEYNSNFCRIVDYILSPNCCCEVVEVISDEILNKYIIQSIDMGGICLFLYCDNHGDEFVIFDVWGIVAYKTYIKKANINHCNQVKNIYAQYLDGSKCALLSKNDSFLNVDLPIDGQGKEILKAIKENIKAAYDTVIVSYAYLRPYVAKIKSRLKDSRRSNHEKIIYLLGFRGKTYRVLYILLSIYKNRKRWEDSKGFNENLHVLFGNTTVNMRDSNFRELLSAIDEKFIIETVNNAIAFFEEKSIKKE